MRYYILGLENGLGSCLCVPSCFFWVCSWKKEWILHSIYSKRFAPCIFLLAIHIKRIERSPNDFNQWLWCPLCVTWGSVGWTLVLLFGMEFSTNTPTISLEQPEIALCQNDSLHKAKWITNLCSSCDSVVLAFQSSVALMSNLWDRAQIRQQLKQGDDFAGNKLPCNYSL